MHILSFPSKIWGESTHDTRQNTVNANPQSYSHHSRELWGCGRLSIWVGLTDPNHLQKPKPLGLSYVNCFKTRDICSFCLLSIHFSYFCNSSLILLWGVPTLSIGEKLEGTVHPGSLLSPGQEVTKHVTQACQISCPLSGILTQKEVPRAELIDLSGSASQGHCLSVTSIFLDPQSYSGFRASKSWLRSLSFNPVIPLRLPGENPSFAFC